MPEAGEQSGGETVSEQRTEDRRLHPFDDIELKFTSSNGIPVERATVKADEWQRLKEWIEPMRQLYDCAKCASCGSLEIVVGEEKSL